MPPPRNEDHAQELINEGGERAAGPMREALGTHRQEATGALPAASTQEAA